MGAVEPAQAGQGRGSGAMFRRRPSCASESLRMIRWIAQAWRPRLRSTRCRSRTAVRVGQLHLNYGVSPHRTPHLEGKIRPYRRMNPHFARNSAERRAAPLWKWGIPAIFLGQFSVLQAAAIARTANPTILDAIALRSVCYARRAPALAPGGSASIRRTRPPA